MIGERDFQNHRLAIFIGNLFYGKLVKILSLIVGNLLPVHRKRLGKIAITIQKANSRHVNA